MTDTNEWHGVPPMKSLPWLEERTILWVPFGSRAYGTQRPDSDYDYRGVACAPHGYRDGFLHTFNQATFKAPDPDATIFELRKFMFLASNCNPGAFEVLFVEDANVLSEQPAGRILREHRDMFLSQKALHTFRGYAMSQLKRIKTHRKWLLKPPEVQPTRVEFGLPERTVMPKDQLNAAHSKITKLLDGWEIDFGVMDEAAKIYVQEQIHKYLTELTLGSDEKYMSAGRLLGYEDNFLDLLDRERHYNNARNSYKQYQDWKKTRNKARAALEADHGYDTKHAMHLVRLMRMCREILTDGSVLIHRPDAQELLDIRNGAWDFDKLMNWADTQDKELVEVARGSSLPKQPNRVAINDLCIRINRMLD